MYYYYRRRGPIVSPDAGNHALRFSRYLRQISQGVMIMDKKNQYVAASLSPNLINEIQSLEEKISEQAHKKVVVIAYENDKS
jgi:hypothetical protein